MTEKNIKIKIGADTAGATRGLTDVHGSMERFRRSAVDLQSPLTNLAGGLAALGLTAVTKNLVDSAMAAERLQRQFTAAAGSVVTATRNFATVKQLANELGLEFQSTAGAYAKFMAATRGTAIEGAQADKVFRGVSEAVAAMGLTSDEAGGIFLALSQMMSKGKVSAEELTGQLGERLPGALKLAADGMGMTTAELLKQMQQGNIMSADLLPKLADEMHKTYGQAATEGAKSATGAMNRFQNAMTEARQELGTQFLPIMTELAEKAAQSAKWIIPLEAELIRLAMLTDKAGGSLTRLGATLSYPGALSGSKTAGDINKWFVEQNKLYESRYNAGDKALQDLADREVGVGKYAPIPAKTEKELAAERARNAARAAAEIAAAAKSAARTRSGGGMGSASGLDYIDAGPMTSLKTIQERMDIDKYALEQWIELGQLPNGFLQVPERTKGKTSLMGSFGGFQSIEQQEEFRAKKDLADQSIVQLQAQLQTEEERMRASYEARLKMVEEYASQYGMAEEKRAELVNKIQAQQAEYEKRQQMTNFTSTLGIIEGQISQFTGLLDQQSKSQFYAWKAFAIAQATISTALAVANILAAESKLGVAAIPLAFGAGAIGAAQIGVIANTEYVAQRELGGPVAGGTPYIVGEKGPELFLPAVNGSIIPNNRLSGGGVAVTNVFQLSTGVSDTVRAELMSMMPVIESRSINAVHSAIESGGPLAKAVGR